METRTYPYGLFAKLTTTTNAEHVTTRHKIHIWMSDLWELKYYGKSRSFTVSHAGAHAPFVTVDDTLRPTFAGELSEPERAILTAVGIVTPDEPKRAPAARTTTNHPVSATPKPARKRRSTEPMAYNSDRHPEQGEQARAIVEANREEYDAMTARQDAARAKRTAQRPPSGAPPAPLPETEGAIVIDGADLKRALTQLKPAVAKRQALPILEAVRLQTILSDEPTRARLSATNLELCIVIEIPATGPLADVAIPYEALSTIAKGTSGPLTLTPHRTRRDGATPTEPDIFTCDYTSASNAGTIACHDPSDCPIIPALSDPIMTTVDRSEFGRMLDRVAIAAAKDDSRPVLAGICLRFGKHDNAKRETVITAYAADGFQLVKDSMITECSTAMPPMLPPARLAAAVKTAIPTDIAALDLTTNKVGALLRIDWHRAGSLWPIGTLTTRLIEGTFPDAEQIIPRDFASYATYDRREMLAATKQCAAIAADNNDVLRLTPALDETTGVQTLTLSAKAADKGSTSATITIAGAAEGQPPEIALNARYLAAALTAIKHDRVRISTNTPNQSVMLSTEGTDVEIIMPMVIGAN